MPQVAKQTLTQLGRVIAQLDAQLAEINRRLAVQHKANPVSQRLAAIPGVGPLTALTVAMKVDAGQFRSARRFAAWLGLTPKQRSTGNRQSLGGISRAGNERLRQLLVVGAMAVIRHAKPGSKTASPWLLQLLERRPRKVAAVALANKMARSLWAELTRVPTDRLRSVGMPAEGMMANGMAYRRTPPNRSSSAPSKRATVGDGKTVEPTNRTPRLVQGHLDAASVFGACSAKPIWAE